MSRRDSLRDDRELKKVSSKHNNAMPKKNKKEVNKPAKASSFAQKPSQ
jgi:hypothetical protein